jgi:hypothetical protein
LSVGRRRGEGEKRRRGEVEKGRRGEGTVGPDEFLP